LTLSLARFAAPNIPIMMVWAFSIAGNAVFVPMPASAAGFVIFAAGKFLMEKRWLINEMV
jgi:hypothetical protein